MKRVAAPALLTVLALLALLAGLLALSLGSVDIAWHRIWSVLLHRDASLEQTLIFQIRLPRTAAAFVTGAMLALAGALYQVLLRNPLADPYILGVSGGASVGALGAMLLALGSAGISAAAMVGALLSTLMVLVLARGDGGWTSNRLLLTGVVIAAGWGAMISFILSISPDQNLRGMLYWLMGDLSNSHMPGWRSAILLIILITCMPLGRSLNLLSHGSLRAASLGVNVGPLRLFIYFAASILTASAVTLAGSVGFIGLVVPHILRLLSGSDHRLLLPASVLLGGTLLMLADTLARTVIAPTQLPVGVLTAFIGVPLFLLLLYRSR